MNLLSTHQKTIPYNGERNPERPTGHLLSARGRSTKGEFTRVLIVFWDTAIQARYLTMKLEMVVHQNVKVVLMVRHIHLQKFVLFNQKF